MTDSLPKDQEEDNEKDKEDKEEDKEDKEDDENEENEENEAEEKFDPTLCAMLYNRLIRIGFHGSNREQEGESLRTNWFEVWKSDPKVEKCRERFCEPLVKFLEQIEIVVRKDGSAPYHDVLIYNYKSIMSPTGIDDDLGLGGLKDAGYDCICLFSTNMASVPHRLGLVMDLDDLLVRYLPSFSCHYDFEDTRRWYTLEDVLLKLNCMAEIGKYVPIIRDNEVRSTMEPGWKAVPWTDSILNETLAAWEDLVNTITARLPDHYSKGDTPSEPEQLAQEDIIPSSIRGFTRGFLLRALKPPFKFIAPGLTVYDYRSPPPPIPMKRDRDETMIYATPYQEMRGAVHHSPIILFPFEESVEAELAGLWILPEEDWADSIRLVLPYELKKFPTARRMFYMQNRTNLFQSPECPLYDDHHTSLRTLLIFWKELVEKGIWTVGAEGIEGGKDFYRQAEDKEKGDWFDVGECFEFPPQVEIHL
ncbi:hypothetical protein H109_05947 [Trichophyton interdigitale MR816]|uniref:Uncharacterized protein n=1 Tax=Trichophyton interdigitale (strain MR816) TaxID=1215338 RepID=A0A059J3A4_TRIIM|nr:hypothetical protein H101_00859 [Trichophyton interdigitale H6]KDB22158.1 hypothetical protein H109_05947 [Trichophyton interdigitale MR816]